MTHFKYEPESIETVKKYLATQEIYDEMLDKNVQALWWIEQKKLHKTIEWHTMIQLANHLKEKEVTNQSA